MLLQISVLILKVWRVAVRCHRMQEVFVRHPELAFFSLMTRKDFKGLLRRREKSYLVLVIPADFFGPGRIETFADLVFFLLFCHVKR